MADKLPAYEVHPFKGKYTVVECKLDPKSKQIVSKEVEREGGFMVYFPKGHSIHVRDEATLRALGYHRPAKIIDMETGDEEGEVQPTLAQRSASMTRTAKSGSRAEGVDA